MAKRTDKSELEAAVTDALEALPTQQRHLLEALYEQLLIVGGGLNLSDLAKGLGLPDATLHKRMERALSEFARQARRHAAVEDWLRAHDQLGQFPKREFTSDSSRLALYFHLSEADAEIFLNSAGPLVLQAIGTAVLLSDCLASVDSVEGRRRVAEYLNSQPFPHYQSAGRDGLLIRIEEDGSRTVGRFIDRQFQAVQC
jgi:hypothetical protein